MLIRPLVLIVQVGGAYDINYDPHSKIDFGVEAAIFHLILGDNVGHGSRLSPSGASKRRARIQWLSFAL